MLNTLMFAPPPESVVPASPASRSTSQRGSGSRASAASARGRLSDVLGLRDQVYRFVQSLTDSQAEWRRRAAVRLALLAEASREGAEEIAVHARAVATLCSDPESEVRGAALSLLQALAEAGQSTAVSIYAPQIFELLQDKDAIVRRQTTSLCWTMALNGCAAALASRTSQIVACLEAPNALRVTPLRVLGAMAAGGEARVVAHEAGQAIVRSLRSKSVAVSIAACDAVAAVVRAGCASTFRSGSVWSHADSWPIFETLIVILQDAPEPDAKLASALALQAFAGADSEILTALRSRFLRRLRNVACSIFGTKSHEIREAISSVVDELPLEEQQRDTEREDSVEDWSRSAELTATRGGSPDYARLRSRFLDRQDDLSDTSNYDERVVAPPPQRRRTSDWQANPRRRYLHSMRDRPPSGQSRRSDAPCPNGDCDPSCVICQQKLTGNEPATALPCGHAFHANCIQTWLGAHRGRTCPICRRRPSGAMLSGHMRSRSASPSDFFSIDDMDMSDLPDIPLRPLNISISWSRSVRPFNP